MTLTPKNTMPFPFEWLPHLSSEQLELRRKIHELYTLAEERSDILNDILTPLSELLGTPLQAKLMHAEELNLDEVSGSLPERFLLSLIRMDPHTKRAFVVFDPLLAQLLVKSTLSGGQIDTSEMALEELKPLTALSEGVVEYIVVSALERITKNLGRKDFTLFFENLIRDSKKLSSLYANSDRFAVFSIRLKAFDLDFYVKLALPLSLAENLGAEERDDKIFSERLQGFGSFKTDFQLEIGHVELEPQDVQDLSPGDILILDECLIDLKADQTLRGEAVLRPVGLETELGFVGELEQKGEAVSLKIVSGL